MTKIARDLSNAARELSAHLASPGKEHWKALERCVGYMANKSLKDLSLENQTT